jgi:hypothetical protein
MFQGRHETLPPGVKVLTGMSPNAAPVFGLVILIFIAGFVVAVSLAYRFKQRELQHRERMAAIEKGGDLPPLESGGLSGPWTPRVYLHRGLVWLFTGIGLMIFLFAMALTAHHEVSASDRVWRANLAKERGATEEQIREIMNDRGQSTLPPALALIALIPMGVGAAYLITYRTERAAGQRP